MHFATFTADTAIEALQRALDELARAGFALEAISLRAQAPRAEVRLDVACMQVHRMALVIVDKVDTKGLRHFCGAPFLRRRRTRRMPCRIGSGSDTAPIGREEAALQAAKAPNGR